MNKSKLEGYRLTGSIHTLSIRSEGVVEDIDESVSNCIIASSQKKDDVMMTTSIVNPNKLMGDVYAYSEFSAALDTILVGAGIGDYSLVRADMRFDSYDPDHYQAYAKLNRYLISAVACTYAVTNCYRSTNLFSEKQLSIAIKNRRFEIENYDKEAESGGTDAAKSRLEIRSKDWSDKSLQAEFIDMWFYRWDKAEKHLDAVNKRYNDELVKLYEEGRKGYPCRFRSLTDFLIEYQDCIFCKQQMIDLLSRIPEVGPGKAQNRADNHKKRYGIEYFSKKDVHTAINEIKRATIAFFES